MQAAKAAFLLLRNKILVALRVLHLNFSTSLDRHTGLTLQFNASINDQRIVNVHSLVLFASASITLVICKKQCR